MGNVWRTSFQDSFSLAYCKFKIYCNYNVFGDPYPPDLIERNVWRTSPFDSVGHPGPPLGQLESQDRSRSSGRATSVGGSAMHMKIPDDLGREAGIGRTQNRKELSYSGLTRVDRPSVE